MSESESGERGGRQEEEGRGLVGRENKMASKANEAPHQVPTRETISATSRATMSLCIASIATGANTGLQWAIQSHVKA